jgi:hypothetical protein
MASFPDRDTLRSLSDQELRELFRARSRPRSLALLGGILFWLMLLFLPLGVCLWLLWPAPPPAAVFLLAFDQAATPGEPVPLRAQVWPMKNTPRPSLAGRTVLFYQSARQPLALGPSPEDWQQAGATEETGQVTVSWQAPATPGIVNYAVQLTNPGQRRVFDPARVFVWPADTSLLLVSVDRTLVTVAPAAWQQRSVVDIPPAQDVGDALLQAQKKKYQIVYLALGVDDPLSCRKVRDWVERRAQAKDLPLPPGPVLGRPCYTPTCEEAQARRLVIQELLQRFHGPHQAVARQVAEVRAFQELGLTCLLVNPREAAPAGVRRLVSWSELPACLEPPRQSPASAPPAVKN